LLFTVTLVSDLDLPDTLRGQPLAPHLQLDRQHCGQCLAGSSQRRNRVGTVRAQPQHITGPKSA